MMNENILVMCKENVGRSQVAEAYINFLSGKKIAISAALLQDRKEKYHHKPAESVVTLMAEEGINVDGQYIKTLSDIGTDVLANLETILLCDTSMKDDPNVERDFSLEGMSGYHYIKKKYPNKIVELDIEDAYQQEVDVSRKVRNIIKQNIKNILHLPNMNNITVEVVNHPNDINDAEFHKIAEVTSHAFGIPMSMQDIKNHIYQNPKIYLSKNNGNIIGFSGVRTYGDFIFRHGTAVHQLFHGIGVYPQMINTIAQDLGRSKFFLRTQNFNVIKSYQKLGFNVLLGEEGLNYLKAAFSDEQLRFVMQDAFEENVDVIVDEKGIFRGVYGGLFGKIGNVEHITSHTYPSFDALHGDSLLVVCIKE